MGFDVAQGDEVVVVVVVVWEVEVEAVVSGQAARARRSVEDGRHGPERGEKRRPLFEQLAITHVHDGTPAVPR